MLRGSCLCGGIAFTVEGPMEAPLACHCSQCRRQSGHVWASAGIRDDQLTLVAPGDLRWFRSSDVARRGFCGTCGSVLFWKQDGTDRIAVATGSLDRPTGLRLREHIFVADMGDYYDIADGLPQRPQ